MKYIGDKLVRKLISKLHLNSKTHEFRVLDTSESGYFGFSYRFGICDKESNTFTHSIDSIDDCFSDGHRRFIYHDVINLIKSQKLIFVGGNPSIEYWQSILEYGKTKI